MENESSPHSSIDASSQETEAYRASSTMETYNFIFNKYRSEFIAALSYDEKKDKKYQREMKKLQKEKESLKNAPQEVES